MKKSIVAMLACTFVVGALSGYLAQEMRTRDNLDAAFDGESRAHMNYLLYSSKAKQEGFENVSRLLYAISYAESVHAGNHANVLGTIGSTGENLQSAIDGETYETEEMYPEFYDTAVEENNTRAQRSFRYAMEAEAVHASFFEEAKNSVDSGEDMELNAVYVCPVCGDTFVDEAPERCPVCNTQSAYFVEF